MKRRQFLGLAASGATGVWASSAGGTPKSRPSQACYEVHALKVRCVSGFAQTPAMVPVACPSLAWAGCLAYLLQGFGADVDLADVLERADQQPSCAPGDDRTQLMRAQGVWQDRKNRRFMLGISELPSLHRPFLSDAAITGVLHRVARQPMLCGAAGHTTLITEIATDQGTMVGVKLNRVTVRDPVLPDGGLRNLSAKERSDPFYVLGFTMRPL